MGKLKLQKSLTEEKLDDKIYVQLYKIVVYPLSITQIHSIALLIEYIT